MAQRDPNKPRKPLSARLLYLLEQKDALGRTMRGANGVTIAAEALRRWQAMSLELQQPYEDRALKLQNEYDAQMATYNNKKKTNPSTTENAENNNNNNTNGDENNNNNNNDENNNESFIDNSLNTSNIDEEAEDLSKIVKKPLTPQQHFFFNVKPRWLEESPETKPTEMSKKLKRKWDTLTEREKGPFIAFAELDRDRYLVEKVQRESERASKRQAEIAVQAMVMPPTYLPASFSTIFQQQQQIYENQQQQQQQQEGEGEEEQQQGGEGDENTMNVNDVVETTVTDAAMNENETEEVAAAPEETTENGQVAEEGTDNNDNNDNVDENAAATAAAEQSAEANESAVQQNAENEQE